MLFRSPENRPKVGQNHAARKAVWASSSVSKEVGLYFGLEAGKRACDRFTCVHFSSANEGHQELEESPWDWKISLKFQEIEPKLVKITMRLRRSRLLFQG